MKKIIFLLTILVLITGCSEQQVHYKKISDKTKTFSIEHESKYSWLKESAEKRAYLNKMRFIYNEEREEKERIKRAERKYWTREFDGKKYFGYDEELDKNDNLY